MVVLLVTMQTVMGGTDNMASSWNGGRLIAENWLSAILWVQLQLPSSLEANVWSVQQIFRTPVQVFDTCPVLKLLPSCSASVLHLTDFMDDSTQLKYKWRAPSLIEEFLERVPVWQNGSICHLLREVTCVVHEQAAELLSWPPHTCTVDFTCKC